MLRWATIFFAIPFVVALMGMSGFAASATHVAMGLFVISLVAFLATFIVPNQEDEDDGYDAELQN